MRLLREIARLLGMQKVVHYKGEEIGEYEDGQIQMRATELLAEFLGKRKNSVELSGPGGIPLSIQYEAVQLDTNDESPGQD